MIAIFNVLLVQLHTSYNDIVGQFHLCNVPRVIKVCRPTLNIYVNEMFAMYRNNVMKVHPVFNSTTCVRKRTKQSLLNSSVP